MTFQACLLIVRPDAAFEGAIDQSGGLQETPHYASPVGELAPHASAIISLDIFSRCSILGEKEADRVIAGSIYLHSAAHVSALVAAAVVLVRLHSGAGEISD